MVKYVLTYLNGRGRAESIRLVFAAADQEFEDKRLDMEKEWATFKPSQYTAFIYYKLRSEL